MTTTSMDAKLGRVSLEVDGSVARIVLRRPPLNIIDIPMMEELAQSLAEIESRPDVSMIVVSGQGTAFSAGVDVAAHTPDKVNEMLTKFHAVIRALVAAKTVTIAAVHGHCLGGGAELAMVCDVVYTTEAAEIGLANRAVPGNGLSAAVDECVGRLRTLSPVALALAKKACYAWDSMHFDKGLARAERIYFDELIKTSDAQEGIRAFMEKREPKWTGQ